MHRFPPVLAFAILLLTASEAEAHEFWISPHSYETAARIIADFRVGQNFLGEPFPLLPFALEKFEVSSGGRGVPVNGRPGDLPALDMEAPDEGLAVITAVTLGTIVEYTDMEMFAAFLDSKGLSEVLDQHRARGLPEFGFTETYRRFAKSLVAVGDGAGQDSELGLETEIVAGANPYTDDMTDGLPVQVLYQGAPRADAQLDIFAREPAGEVTLTSVRSDGDGRYTVPVRAGVEYLLDAVTMRPALETQEEGAPVWQSLWASLTFRVPADR